VDALTALGEQRDDTAQGAQLGGVFHCEEDPHRDGAPARGRPSMIVAAFEDPVPDVAKGLPAALVDPLAERQPCPLE
jgi:hypothetical protein